MSTATDTRTVHEAIVEALDSTYDHSKGNTHGQRCPCWTQRACNPPVWRCDCWILPRLVKMANAVCATLDGAR